MGVPRPSYQQVRLLVHDARQRRSARQAARRDALIVILEVCARRRSPEALYDLLTSA
jgi:hypothetical protein